MSRLHILFIGQNTLLSVRALEMAVNRADVAMVLESRFRTSSVVPQSELKTVADRNGIPYGIYDGSLSPLLKSLRLDLGCVASMSQMIPSTILAIPRMGFINVHPSLLPAYRGPNPWFWQIYHMEPVGGVSVHYLTGEEDAGDILVQEPFEIIPGTDPELLVENAAEVGSRLLSDSLDRLSRGRVRGRPQGDPAGKPRARLLRASEQLIRWREWDIERVAHVLNGTRLWYDGLFHQSRIRTLVQWKVLGTESGPVSKAPGRLRRDSRGFYVGHAQGRIRIDLKMNWRNLIPRDWIRRHLGV